MILDKSLLYVNKDINHESSTNNLFQYSLEALIESNDIIIKKLEEEAYITELFGSKSAKVFDFYGIINAIIGAFVDIIKTLVGKFLGILTTLASQGKAFYLTAKAFESRIRTYTGSFVLEDIFIYSNIGADSKDTSYPGIDLGDNFTYYLDKYIDKFNRAVESSTIASNVILSLDTTDVDFQVEVSSFRRYLLGIKNSNELISDDRFNDECYKLFRSGESVPREHQTFKADEIYNYFYKPYMESNKIQSQTKKEAKKIQDDCKSAKNKLNKFTPNLDKFQEPDYSNILNVYNRVQRNVCTLFDYECRDVVTIYGAKLEACKESYVQARRIIKNCMVRIAEETPFRDRPRGMWN